MLLSQVLYKAVGLKLKWMILGRGGWFHCLLEVAKAVQSGLF